ncbi:TIGR04197 family type VII secretion effector [Pseudobutyrivibrio sp.]|uniref:TIGR04197 family type VII secretion effector n=1 Tax=Pseudobutyrivibrio sp. TaxID=2014367 RepID=UPI0038686FF1
MSDVVSIEYASVEEYASLLLSTSENAKVGRAADPIPDTKSTIPANNNAHAAFADDRSQHELLQARGVKESENLTKVKDAIKQTDEDLANS